MESIDNFILIYFEKNDYTPDNERVKGRPTERRAKLIPLQKEFMVKRLRYLYPKSTIHILTDQVVSSNENQVIYHYQPFEKNYQAKLEVFGLLDEPAMFIDLDVLLIKKFEIDLTSAQAFNLYTAYPLNLDLMSSKATDITEVYNSGVIWINQPNKNLVEELKHIQKTHFSDLQKIAVNNGVLYNDEYPITILSKRTSSEMLLINDVNVPRHRLSSFQEVAKQQSVHYNGNQNKYLMMLEMPLVYNSVRFM